MCSSSVGRSGRARSRSASSAPASPPGSSSGRSSPGGTFPTPGAAPGRRSWRSCSTGGSPRRLPLAPREPPPLLLCFRLQARVLLHRQMEQLALELPPADETLLVERPRLERGAHAAVGLGLVRAVVEPAERR